MTFEDLLRYYKAKVPQGTEAEGTPEYAARFNSWTSQLERELGIPGGDFNDPASGWSGVSPGALDEFETQGGGGPTTTMPLEQDLLGRVVDDYVYPNLERDRLNKIEADRILAETNRSLDNAVRLNAENVNSGFNAEGYIRNNYPNPSDWPAARAGLQSIVDAGLAGSLDQAAQYHFNTYGKAEGKQPSYVGTLGAELANAAEVEAGLAASARTQGAANQAGIDADQRNLSAAIGTASRERLGAVDQSTAAMRAGQGEQERDVVGAVNTRTGAIDGAITADDAARRAAIEQATARMREGQSAQERDVVNAVTTRTDAIDGAITADDATRQAAIARMTAALRDGSMQLDAARRAALAEEINKLKAGSSELTATQLSALADETTSLGAALDLSSAARDRNLAVLEGTRLAAAEGQVAGVNLGLERTRDELSARQAERGFIGGSSMDDANLARAAIGARQQAAGIVGDTRVNNATDRRTLGDAVAGERLNLATRDATGRRTIVTDGAGRTFDLVGRDAGGGRTIAEEGAARAFDITGQDAGLTREATVETSGNRLSNTTAGATDIFGARKTGADNRFAITGEDATLNREAANLTSGNRLSNTTAGATDIFGARKTGADTRFAITGDDATARLGVANEAAGRGFEVAGLTGERTLGNVFATSAGEKDATDKGTQMGSDYFDNNNTRRLASALVPATIGTNRLQLLTSADEIGNAGLTRSLNNLNFFTSNATPSPAGTFTTNPSQVGNDIAALGAGVAGTAINIGNANKWWQTPKTPAPTTKMLGGAAKPPVVTPLPGTT
jgi:hypothetical protein